MSLIIINSVLDEVKRRLGVTVDETELFSDEELTIYINKYASSIPETRDLYRAGDMWKPRENGEYWFLDYAYLDGSTGVGEANYEEDTVHGVVTVIPASGMDDDADVTKTATVYSINMDLLMSDIFNDLAQSHTKLARLVTISPGASWNTTTLADNLRKQARALRERKWYM